MKTDILLIEDCPEDIDLALRVLNQDNPGTNITVMHDGAEALQHLFDEFDHVQKHHLPRVIFLDVKLPRLTGPQVLHKLKSHAITRTIPVVIMTSSNQEQDIVDCYSFGANSYLVKPIDYKKYKTMIVTASRYWLSHNLTVPV